MAYTKTILCLAASRKHGGYCIAGKDIKTGEWIRPVSSRPDEEISNNECTMRNGTQATLLDIIEIPLLREIPSSYQSENHLIDPSGKWMKKGEGTWKKAKESIDDHSGPLWLNQDASFGYLNNRVNASAVAKLDNSLMLTDPIIEHRFLAGADRIENLTGAVLCVSLGEIYRGHAYKLVAAVIEPPRGR